MIVLVDTTVWIDFFAARSSDHVMALDNLIRNREDICICGIILTEVLQGIRKDSQFKKTRELFNNLLFLPMPYPVFLRAAEIYRSLRRKGITLRKSVDCMIASVAIENDIPLLHNDKDFKAIEEHCGLKCYII
ncbi:MAG: Ribonuclease VapC15 [Candidatus Methanoperedenaceae archaeon GB37]|nr:MAG: Ribonuclease VapC15 [Candidatus Methanoperedenaceae archaeon GB37]